jgi:hypothetical protein
VASSQSEIRTEVCGGDCCLLVRHAPASVHRESGAHDCAGGCVYWPCRSRRDWASAWLPVRPVHMLVGLGSVASRAALKLSGAASAPTERTDRCACATRISTQCHVGTSRRLIVAAVRSGMCSANCSTCSAQRDVSDAGSEHVYLCRHVVSVAAFRRQEARSGAVKGFPKGFHKGSSKDRREGFSGQLSCKRP